MLALIATGLNAAAAATFEVPALTGPVLDLANVVSPRDKQYLDVLIRRIYDSAHVQLQVLVVPTLFDEPIEQASIAVTDKWRLGKKGDDKGVLLMVSINDHKIRIEVGRGLEGELPDLIASRIVREVITPQFRGGEISGGIVAGVQSIASVVAPDVLDQPAPQHRRTRGDGASALFFIIFMMVSLLFGGLSRRRGFIGGGGFYGGGGGFGGGGGWSGGGGGFSGGGASGGW